MTGHECVVFYKLQYNSFIKLAAGHNNELIDCYVSFVLLNIAYIILYNITQQLPPVTACPAAVCSDASLKQHFLNVLES